MKDKFSFNYFCEKHCCNLYNPGVEMQCTGYYKLRQMVLLGIEPATEEEELRWRTNPTKEELLEKPSIKYLDFLHVNIRHIIIDNWDLIKTLKIDE